LPQGTPGTQRKNQGETAKQASQSSNKANSIILCDLGDYILLLINKTTSVPGNSALLRLMQMRHNARLFSRAELYVV
jgi:hypothetical protein